MFSIRHDLRPGDLGAIVALHGAVYSAEHGFDATFEAYVAAPLAEFALRGAPRDRLWIAEADARLAGCIAIVEGTPVSAAQLRWFLVAPAARGGGLGRRLLGDAIGFCRERGYNSIYLRTVSALTTAARLYRSVGFETVEERPGHLWGLDVVEQRYDLPLRS